MSTPPNPSFSWGGASSLHDEVVSSERKVAQKYLEQIKL